MSTDPLYPPPKALPKFVDLGAGLILRYDLVEGIGNIVFSYAGQGWQSINPEQRERLVKAMNERYGIQQ